MNKWFCCSRHDRGLKNVHVGPEAQKLRFLDRDSCWEHSWADSAANASTLVSPVETKTAKCDCGHISLLGCGTWKPSSAMGAKDAPGCLWHLFLLQPPPGAMSSKNKENILCFVLSLIMTTPWSYWIVLDLFQCQSSFVDLDSGDALRLRLPPCANPQSEQAFCPQIIRVNPHR